MKTLIKSILESILCVVGILLVMFILFGMPLLMMGENLFLGAWQEGAALPILYVMFVVSFIFVYLKNIIQNYDA